MSGFFVCQRVHWYNSYGVYIGIVTIVGIEKNFYPSNPDREVYYVAPNDSHWCPVGGDSRFYPVVNAYHVPEMELKYMDRHRKQQEFNQMMKDLRNTGTFTVN